MLGDNAHHQDVAPEPPDTVKNTKASVGMECIKPMTAYPQAGELSEHVRVTEMHPSAELNMLQAAECDNNTKNC